MLSLMTATGAVHASPLSIVNSSSMRARPDRAAGYPRATGLASWREWMPQQCARDDHDRGRRLFATWRDEGLNLTAMCRTDTASLPFQSL
jgi:hypothetical protein